MSRFYPPPQPFIGGRQPLEQRKLPPSITAVPVDQPPRFRLDAFYAVRQQWEPGPPQPWQIPPRQTITGIAVVPYVPVGVAQENLGTILQAWVPGPHPPWQIPPRRIVSVDQPPGYTTVFSWEAQPAQPWQIPPRQIVSVDQPPRFSTDPLYAIRQTWELPPPQPWQLPPRQTTSGVAPVTYVPVGVAAENLATVLQAWQPAPPAPWQIPPRQISSVDQPPGYTTVYTWEPDSYYPWQGWRKVVPPTAAPADTPPRKSLASLYSVLETWLPDAPVPQQSRARQILSVDQPPRYSASALYELRQLCEPIPPPPWQIPPRQIVSVDQPPGYTTVFSWEPQPAQPWQIPPRRIVSVDQPPFGWPNPSLNEILRQWQPGPPAPWQIPPRQIVSVDNPPRYSSVALYELRQAWEPGPPAPIYTPPRQVVSVDQPPPRSRLEPHVRQAWEPGPPPAQGWRYVIPSTLTPAVDNPPPYSLAFRLQALNANYAWQPGPPQPTRNYLLFQRGIGISWQLRGTIIRTAAGTQKCVFTLTTGSGLLPATVQYATATENLAAPVNLKLVISGSLDGDVAGELYKEVWFPTI